VVDSRYDIQFIIRGVIVILLSEPKNDYNHTSDQNEHATRKECIGLHVVFLPKAPPRREIAASASVRTPVAAIRSLTTATCPPLHLPPTTPSAFCVTRRCVGTLSVAFLSGPRHSHLPRSLNPTQSRLLSPLPRVHVIAHQLAGDDGCLYRRCPEPSAKWIRLTPCRVVAVPSPPARPQWTHRQCPPPPPHGAMGRPPGAAIGTRR